MIEFPENIILENKRVLLRPLVKTDIEFLDSFAINEPEIWQFSPDPIGGAAGLKKYINATVDLHREKKEYPFIVFDKLSNRFAGSTRFYDIQLQNLTTQLGYTWYGKDFRRTGLNRNCKLLMLEFAFEKWGMERVEFRAHIKNERSIAAMKAIGCTAEGILRSVSASSTGGRRDSMVLSILKEEWYNGIRVKLRDLIH
ncbi:MAG TPA: GNAT family protein [Puia sp.]|nr:GNAT family protein [Puia sp.]